MEELKKCPVCNHEKFDLFKTCIDYTVSKESFAIVNCLNCGFKLLNPRPSANELGKYYESDDYVSHSNSKKGIINKIYHFVKFRAIRKKIDLISSLKTKNKTLLDIGCGTGDFLGKAIENGWTGVGIEPNEKARNTAISNYKSTVYGEEKLSGMSTNSFSVISMWHVLEHVSDLNKRIRDINNLLEKDGYAVIAVPNYTSWDAKHYDSYWAAYDVPRHLYNFSPNIIKELFLKHNLQPTVSYPMKLDSYYVSMLSEKYKKSYAGLIRAFIVGFISNFKTKNDAEKYSSVIYIFQKK